MIQLSLERNAREVSEKGLHVIVQEIAADDQRRSGNESNAGPDDQSALSHAAKDHVEQLALVTLGAGDQTSVARDDIQLLHRVDHRTEVVRAIADAAGAQ